MTRLIIDVTPDLERRLQEQAANRGQTMGDYARAVLEQSLAPPAPKAEPSLYDGLPRRAPEELDALAAA